MYTRSRNPLSYLPPVTKNLIIINLLIWFLMLVCPASMDQTIMRYGALHYFEASDFNPAQIFTYMFMHSTQSFAHVLFNMFTLFMFGVTLERIMGSARFLFYYLACGIGAAIIQEVVWAFSWESIFAMPLANINGVSLDTMRSLLDQAVTQGQSLPFLNQLQTIGASGAVFGILLAFGMIFPDMPLYIMFIPIPVKAKWMVLGYGVIEVLLGLATASDGVAHFAHLGGMIFGFFMILYWRRKGLFRPGSMY